MSTTAQRVERAAIEAAEAYARENGWPEDRKAAGLVLAGMAVMASCPDDVRRVFLAGYLDSFPDARSNVRGWAAYVHERSIEGGE